MQEKRGSTPGEDVPQVPFSSDRQHASPARLDELEARLVAARPRLHRLARLRGVPPDGIEDVVQETLFESWKHLDRLYAPEGFLLWLDEICRNVCRRHARKQLMELQHSFPFQEDDDEEANLSLLNTIPDPDVLDPVEALNRQDVAVLLDRALGSLSGSAREIIELCYLVELPQREVATRLDLSLSALEARLHRARHQLRQILNGPLRIDAEALGLALDQEYAGGWRETRLWCTLCGRHRLSGVFLSQPDGSANLHMQCPACEQRYGLRDTQSNNVHSKGLVLLDGLQSFRPAWKRTMQAISRLLMGTLHPGASLCPYCGTPASIRLIEKTPVMQSNEAMILPPGLARHPSQFWLWWDCPRCGHGPGAGGAFFAASDLVYWSYAHTRQFMREHPRWISEPELLVEYAGQPAIRFQMADVTSSARLTVLAHRQTLRALAFF
ncbi:MAG TPA: sigma-70 family RNA polymerase sigma factor [Ktedonobacteraceae bacterium]|nr:sigma-70 family RNA polymerase sigma factor [Ktedonobacteraceae bacterium]